MAFARFRSTARPSAGGRTRGYLERLARTDQIDALNAKSDDELARMGLKRDDIPRHVFRDAIWL
ncbi:hypothetical protein [Tranquillimonas alkanivorans]|uniref:DUF1127 domain-containing protein n=1 Tax=Tranquillimonas alkanivorans TaxID=441119 RepID=A0A1I5KNX5_9RHOB|nr:hypothetical protein [Tranquillimonas alkanivorans]SFO86790.1 hypothetical protein SAMN04488047_101236 [Tranquillimonas alkanivorans]